MVDIGRGGRAHGGGLGGVWEMLRGVKLKSLVHLKEALAYFLRSGTRPPLCGVAGAGAPVPIRWGAPTEAGAHFIDAEKMGCSCARKWMPRYSQDRDAHWERHTAGATPPEVTCRNVVGPKTLRTAWFSAQSRSHGRPLFCMDCVALSLERAVVQPKASVNVETVDYSRQFGVCQFGSSGRLWGWALLAFKVPLDIRAFLPKRLQ